MRCSTNRKRLQEWFDKPVSPLPTDVAAHVKNCIECRTLVTRWNAIELEIQAMRGEAPELPADFAENVRHRLRESEDNRIIEWPRLAWRVASISAAAMVAVLALFFVLGGAKILNLGLHSGTEANIRPPVHSNAAPDTNINR